MASIMEMSLMCRLCLAKDKNQVNIPIFEDPGDIRQIFVKISSCLPIKISRDDQLPKNICDGCGDKLELLYEFWNTSLDSEKTLTAWLKQVKDPAVSAVTQQISKPAETLVKEETDAAEASTYLEPAQESSINEEAEIEEVEPEEPPKKRARRTAAVKAQINIAPESDDEDDNFDNNMDEPDSVDADVIAKLEGESEESDGDEKDPSFADLPGTSTQDQPGTSGLGKDGAEAPEEIIIEYINSDDEDEDVKAEAPVFVILTDKGYECPYCHDTFSDVKDVNAHIDTHTAPVSNDCVFCKEIFLNAKDLNDHMRDVHYIKRKFPCETCDRVFNTEHHRYNHECVGKNAWLCSMCPSSFSTIHLLDLHLKSHNKMRKIECHACNEFFENKGEHDEHFLQSHCVKNENGKLICNVCESEFESLPECAIHYQDHLPTGSHQCELCSMVFLEQGQLNKHVKLRHSDQRVICDICGSSLSNERGLLTHMKRHKQFQNKTKYSGHCKMCNNKFYKDLKRHFDESHGNELQCHLCDKVFRSNRGLTFHMMVHKNAKPYQCKFCGVSYVMQSLLKNHLRTHPESGELPFKCEICNRQFTRKHVYMGHMNIHNEVKPYQCDICFREYTSQKYLGQHKRLSHKRN